jgi:RNA polymerase II subunit A small phosphatase-like protein
MPQEEKAGRPVSDEPSHADTTVKPKKKKGFLSFLCCGSASDASDPTFQDEPARTVAQSSADRPSQSASAPLDQHANGATTPFAPTGKESVDGSQARQEPQALSEKPVLSDPSVNKPVPDLPSEATAERSTLPGVQQQQTAASHPEIVPLVVTPDNYAMTSTTDASGPSVDVQPPTPIGADGDVDAPISDRTAAQKAVDDNIEISDAGPNVPLSEEEAEQITHQQQQQAGSDAAHGVTLPPPPPLAERSVDGSVHSSQDAQQKWLLPPVRPEHQGRKCLVLDLDETLVHSSFKVRICHTTSLLSHN